MTTPELCPLPRPSRGLPVPRGARRATLPTGPQRQARCCCSALGALSQGRGVSPSPTTRGEQTLRGGAGGVGGQRPIQGSGAPFHSHRGSKSKVFSRCLRFFVSFDPAPPPLASASLRPSGPPVPPAASLLAHDQHEDGSIPPPHHPTMKMNQYPSPLPHILGCGQPWTLNSSPSFHFLNLQPRTRAPPGRAVPGPSHAEAHSPGPPTSSSGAPP